MYVAFLAIRNKIKILLYSQKLSQKLLWRSNDSTTWKVTSVHVFSPKIKQVAYKNSLQNFCWLVPADKSLLFHFNSRHNLHYKILLIFYRLKGYVVWNLKFVLWWFKCITHRADHRFNMMTDLLPHWYNSMASVFKLLTSVDWLFLPSHKQGLGVESVRGELCHGFNVYNETRKVSRIK